MAVCLAAAVCLAVTVEVVTIRDLVGKRARDVQNDPVVRWIMVPEVGTQRVTERRRDIIVDIRLTLTALTENEGCEVSRVGPVVEVRSRASYQNVVDQIQNAGMARVIVNDAEQRRENKVGLTVRSMVLVNARWGHRK